MALRPAARARLDRHRDGRMMAGAWFVSGGLAIALILGASPAAPSEPSGHAPAPAIRELDIAAGIIDSLLRGQLTDGQLRLYFERNATLLAKNIDQAKAKYEEDDLGQLVRTAFPRYLDNRALILSNYERFSKVRDRVVERVHAAYDADVPAVVLVPCIGLFSAGGWADSIDGTRHIFVALERLSEEELAMDLLLTHEIAHAVSEVDGRTVLGGFYDEGHATYVAAALWPGREEETYFLDMNEERYDRYLGWIDRNREKILEDSPKPFVVLDDVHKLYFTTSFSDFPNIGYVIGFKYVAYLNERYTLRELRTLGMNEAENRKEFGEFILNDPLGRHVGSRR